MNGNFDETKAIETAEQEQTNETAAKEKKEAKKTTKAIKKNVYQKLMAIQTTIKAPKNLYNSFGKYNYRNAEGILEAVKPYLDEQECVLIMEDQISVVGSLTTTKETKEGTVTKEVPCRYIKAIAHFIDCETGEEITTSAFANECEHTGMSGDQCTGTASSYARKYCLNALFLLDDTKDSDTDEMKNIENNAKASENKTTQINGSWGNKRTTSAQQTAEKSTGTNNGGWGKPAQTTPSTASQAKGWGSKGA